jgi:Zn-dependent protease with chaperone function
VPALLLTLLAVVLAGVAPRVMARLVRFRRAPRPALVAWQAVSLAAVLSALAAAPAAVPSMRGAGWLVLALALLISGFVLARLLVSGHRIGTRLRSARARHRDLVDLLATPDGRESQVRVLDHATPTAYCLPGRRSRVVLTQGALAALPREELEAVLEHERAHLRGRHDLLLEYFSVLHHSAPLPLRSSAALSEVRFLVEVLADRAAVRTSGPLTTARALMTLAKGQAPEAGLGAGGDATTAARIRLLAEDPLPLATVVVMYAYAGAVVSLPVILLWLAWR